MTRTVIKYGMFGFLFLFLLIATFILNPKLYPITYSNNNVYVELLEITKMKNVGQLSEKADENDNGKMKAYDTNCDASAVSENNSKCLCIERRNIYNDTLDITKPSEMTDDIIFIKDMKNPCFLDKQLHYRCFPFFFNIGPQKSATTDLHVSISQHPDILMPENQESNWFNRRRFGIFKNYKRMSLLKYTENFSKGFRKLMEFNNCERAKNVVIGDGTSTSLYDNLLWRHIPENVNKSEPVYISADLTRKILPDAKFIGVFRNPTDRLWSDYTYYARNRRNASAADFHEKVTP